MIDSIYMKDENCHPQVFLEKYYFIEGIETFCSNSDEEYYDEEYINLFLKLLKNKKICKYLKFPPEILKVL